VNIVEPRHIVFPILGEATASSPSKYYFLELCEHFGEIH